MLWATKRDPSQNREGEGGQALGGRQANQKINNQIEDGVWDGGEEEVVAGLYTRIMYFHFNDNNESPAGDCKGDLHTVHVGQESVMELDHQIRSPSNHHDGG